MRRSDLLAKAVCQATSILAGSPSPARTLKRAVVHDDEVLILSEDISRAVGRFRSNLESLQHLAALPTTTPESAGLCALDTIGNLIRVTDSQ